MGFYIITICTRKKKKIFVKKSQFYLQVHKVKNVVKSISARSIPQVGKLCLKLNSQYKVKEIKIEFD
jgi:hypothetical protein